jgi:hypothetical protein
MPDTGAPYFLPWPDPTDLVRDAPQAFEDLAVATASGLDLASVIVQVVQTVKTDTFSTTSTTPVSVTGLSVSITPSSNTNKILLILDVRIGSHFDGAHLRVSGGNSGNYIGDAASSRTRRIGGWNPRPVTNTWEIITQTAGGVYLDSPATTSPVTYQVETWGSNVSSSSFINRSFTDSNNSTYGREASSITAIEVVA